MRPLHWLLCCLACSVGQIVHAADIVVIGHNNVPKLDAMAVSKLYTGRFVVFEGVSITPVAARPGTPERAQFLRTFVQQEEDQYTAYWTVRRYIGKGTPPRVLDSIAEVLQFVQSTPGAIGYLYEHDVPSGVRIVAR